MTNEIKSLSLTFVNVTDKLKDITDINGKSQKVSKARALMHELVGHAIPLSENKIKTPKGKKINSIERENRVIKELNDNSIFFKEPIRKSDPTHTVDGG
jgi:hypothetical protein